MYVIGLLSSNQGSGTDSAQIAMGEGNDALGGAASKVRCRTLVVAMVGGPAVSTAPVIGAVAGLMPRVLTVTSETVNMRGEGTLSLAKRSSWRGPWVLHPSSLQAILTFALSRIVVRGSLCCEDARNNAAGWAPRPSAYQVRGQSRSDCCVGKVSFHLILFVLSLQFLSPQLDTLLSDGGNAKVLVSEGVYISYDPRISQV